LGHPKGSGQRLLPHGWYASLPSAAAASIVVWFFQQAKKENKHSAAEEVISGYGQVKVPTQRSRVLRHPTLLVFPCSQRCMAI
jgi:hypothetical protein